ncbi:MAG: hypothetical protein KIS80_00320 [Anaerolineales bacterium]|nr:hypothetical protein [Anaerolineales bacterium]
MRRLAKFALWSGLFGLFLTFAAYSVGQLQLEIAGGSLALLLFAWLILRKPERPFQAERPFRTLRKLGLLGRPHHPED